MVEADVYYRIILLLILLILSGIFSSSETALLSMNIAKIRKIKETDEKTFILLKRIKKKLDKMLATILIGNNLVNIAATAVLTQLVFELFGQKGSTLIATVVMTVLILVFGEITPKTYASQNSISVAKKFGRMLEILSVLVNPIVFILGKVTNIVIRIAGGEVNINVPFVTEEEIRMLVDVGEEEGILHHQEKEMIEGIFDIDDIDVSDVMVPRIDIIAIPDDSTLEDAVKTIVSCGHSRIPIFKDTVDNIIGVLYAKDILPFVFLNNHKVNEKCILDIMREAYYIPETKKINKLLKELQQSKIHIAIVLDEYGGTEGLVTIEDILEEIVGDIFDEYDDEIKLIEKAEKNVYKVKAESSLEVINEVFKTDLPEEDFDSIGGFIFSTLGRVPSKGDEIKYDNMVMIVTKVNNRRIIQIEIHIDD